MVLKYRTDAARTAAVEARSTRYEGHPCIHCQGTERYTSSGGCVRCAAERATRVHVEAAPYKPRSDSARGAALASDSVTYEGAPCVTCTGTERYTSSGSCAHCTKVRSKERAANPPAPRTNQPRRVIGAHVPPRPDDGRCEACGAIAFLVMDHDHELEAYGFEIDESFRGWICHNCNGGIARLGDSIAGLELRLAYLRRAQERLTKLRNSA
jgi:hypothetical protein